MKYILMMQFPLSLWKTQRLELWPKQDAKAHMDFLKRFNQELIDAGEFVRTEGLGGPEQMKIVRATKNGAAAITDGPFPESKEVLAGYWVIDVETPQRAYELAPQVLGAVVRRYGNFAAAEDAVQEALLAAAQQWPREGMPDNPRGWLIQVGARRMTDHIRAELARRRREAVVVMQAPADEAVVPALDAGAVVEQDDTLILLFMCCHPALTRPSSIALTLRAVGGLTTAEIANGFLVPEATMAQRISRAKQRIKSSGLPFRLPTIRQ